jgi:hypothetical protein
MGEGQYDLHIAIFRQRAWASLSLRPRASFPENSGEKCNSPFIRLDWRGRYPALNAINETAIYKEVYINYRRRRKPRSTP